MCRPAPIPRRASPRAVESNNCGLADGVLTVLGPSAGHSDLVVTAVTDPPATALPSASFQIAATVKNQGTDPAPATTTSFYLVNTSTGIKKSLKGGQSVPALAPGASDSSVVTITLFSDTIAATYFVQASRRRAEERVGRGRDEQLRQCRGRRSPCRRCRTSRSARSRIRPRSVTLGASFKLTNSVRNVGSAAARPPPARSTTWSPPWTERRRISRARRSSRPSMAARPSARSRR